jgi:hypothetical protein
MPSEARALDRDPASGERNYEDLRVGLAPNIAKAIEFVESLIVATMLADRPNTRRYLELVKRQLCNAHTVETGQSDEDQVLAVMVEREREPLGWSVIDGK